MMIFFGIGIVVGISILVVTILYFLVILFFYKKPNQGEAIIRLGLGGQKVVFDKGIFIIPLFHNSEKIDLTIKKINIERIGTDAVICKNYERVELKVAFFFRVHRTSEDIQKVAMTIGSTRTWKTNEIFSLFEPKCTEFIKSVGHQFSSDELLSKQTQFREKLINRLGSYHNGFILDDCTIYDLKKISA